MGLPLLVRDFRREPAYERGGSAEPSWKRLHGRLVSFAKRRAGLEWEEGRLFREAIRLGVHRRLGFASFLEYVERIFGYNGRLVKEKLRVAQALEGLALTSDALRSGDLSWSAVRELTRVATAETETAWLGATRGLTVRQVEELVSGRAPGDLPSDAPDPRLRRHVLRFEVTGETRALWLEAVAKLRRDAGEALDDDAALLQMARKVLAANDGEKADGRGSSYQVLVTVCKECQRGEQIGNGEEHAIAPAIVEMSCCDAQVIGDLREMRAKRQPVGSAPASAPVTPVGSGPAARAVGSAPASAPVTPAGSGPAARVVGSAPASAPVTPVGSGAPTEFELNRRATQTIPPALRRYVVRRDNGRCVVSGCKHTIVDVHHLIARADGGPHGADNLVCLCGAHHRAVHEGRLIIGGTPSTGLTFKHADGTRYGGAVRVEVAARNAQVFSALRGLGFKERECRAALDQCSQVLAPTAGRAELLRAALKALAG